MGWTPAHNHGMTQTLSAPASHRALTWRSWGPLAQPQLLPRFLLTREDASGQLSQSLISLLWFVRASPGQLEEESDSPPLFAAPIWSPHSTYPPLQYHLCLTGYFSLEPEACSKSQFVAMFLPTRAPQPPTSNANKIRNCHFFVVNLHPLHPKLQWTMIFYWFPLQGMIIY